MVRMHPSGLIGGYRHVVEFGKSIILMLAIPITI